MTQEQGDPLPRKKLTKADWRTIAYALNCAIQERDSYADAWGKGKEADRALKAVKQFKAVHLKIFGERSAIELADERLAVCDKISIFDLMAPKGYHHAHPSSTGTSSKRSVAER